MQALFIKGDLSEADVREILAVCRALEQRKHRPIWFAIMDIAPTYREAEDKVREVEFQRVSD